MKHFKTEDYLNICLSLSAEKDREKLLSDILDRTMDLNNCDAGTLYLIGENGLTFCRMVTKSMGIRQGGHADPITLPPVPLEEKYISSWSVMHREIVYVDSVRNDIRFDFSGPKRYDEMTGYFTGTMCVIPLQDEKGQPIGVIQLINAMDEKGDIIAFDKTTALMTKAMASLAAICLTNMQYAGQIEDLMHSLVGAMSVAIDERTPYNANHTRNMVRYSENFLRWLSESGNPLAFDQDKHDAFIMAVWLHDVGKLVVPLEVMDKPDRLGTKLNPLLTRFKIIRLLTEIEFLSGRINETRKAERYKDLDEAEKFILRINTAGFLPDDQIAKVKELAAKTYLDEDGIRKNWLTDEETEALSIKKGTLTDRERGIMQSHASATEKILSGVHFPKQYADTPIWAANHHEFLDGTGYPRGLEAKDIPFEVRLLTIIDIFDALTAEDRPYKPPMPYEKALRVLDDMADDGQLDKVILELFEESRAWEINRK